MAGMPPPELARQLFEESGRSLPVDVDSIAESQGATVRVRRFEDVVSGMLVIKGDKGIITVNEGHHPNRRRFTAAHELGHYLLHRDAAALFVDASPVFFRDRSLSGELDHQEVQANQFAATLLMPEDMLEAQIREQPVDAFDDVAIRRLAARFGVSIQALTIRLTRLGLVGDYFDEATW